MGLELKNGRCDLWEGLRLMGRNVQLKEEAGYLSFHMVSCVIVRSVHTE